MLPDIGLNDDVPLRTIRSSVTTLDVETSFRAAYANAPDGVTFKKTRKRLVRQALETIQTYGLDTSKSSSQPAKWLVCLSGGKDSYALLSILLELKYLGAAILIRVNRVSQKKPCQTISMGWPFLIALRPKTLIQSSRISCLRPRLIVRSALVCAEAFFTVWRAKRAVTPLYSATIWMMRCKPSS